MHKGPSSTRQLILIYFMNLRPRDSHSDGHTTTCPRFIILHNYITLSYRSTSEL